MKTAHRHIRTIRTDVLANLLSLIIPGIIWIAGIVALEVYLPDYAKFGVMAFGVWLVWRALRILVILASASYTVYDDVVVASIGIFARRVTQVRVADIRGMNVSQSLIGRIFGYGDVSIGTAATGAAEIVMRSVRAPAQIIDDIDALRER